MKYLHRFFFALLIVPIGLITACDSEPALPVGERDMVLLLSDIQIAEAAMSGISWENKDSLTGVYYQQVFDIHGVRQEEFARTMDLIRQDPEVLERVYNGVTLRLDSLKSG